MTQQANIEKAISEISESIRDLVKVCRIINERLKALETKFALHIEEIEDDSTSIQ